MNIVAGETYHIYNQGNNQETLFYEDADYLQFLKLFRKFVYPKCKVLAYCLMPNHFHFLIHATEESEKLKIVGNIHSCELANGFRLLQSSYTSYVNKKKDRSGSLFRQRAKAKELTKGDTNYGFIAFHYIHQNPIRAGLVKKLEDWKYSSFNDYAGFRKGTLCNREFAFLIIGFDKENILRESYQMVDEEKVPFILMKR